MWLWRTHLRSSYPKIGVVKQKTTNSSIIFGDSPLVFTFTRLRVKVQTQSSEKDDNRRTRLALDPSENNGISMPYQCSHSDNALFYWFLKQWSNLLSYVCTIVSPNPTVNAITRLQLFSRAFASNCKLAALPTISLFNKTKTNNFQENQKYWSIHNDELITKFCFWKRRNLLKQMNWNRFAISKSDKLFKESRSTVCLGCCV